MIRVLAAFILVLSLLLGAAAMPGLAAAEAGRTAPPDSVAIHAAHHAKGDADGDWHGHAGADCLIAPCCLGLVCDIRMAFVPAETSRFALVPATPLLSTLPVFVERPPRA